jgi:hypothetical protein
MTRAIVARPWAFLLPPVLCGSLVFAQTPRLRGLDHELPPEQESQPAPAPAQTTPAPPAAAPATAATAPAQMPGPASSPAVAPSMLQQPAEVAQIVFENNNLSIQANNSSLSEILHQISAKSGMKVEGLGGDERVFGTFGPGAPRDVIADLLNGTAYNQVLLGDLSNGAPREVILTPATHAATGAPVATPQAAVDEAANEPETPEPPPQQQSEPPQPGATPPPTPGVRTPQQIFEQLQRMRQGQGAQQPPPVQQDSPMQ